MKRKTGNHLASRLSLKNKFLIIFASIFSFLTPSSFAAVHSFNNVNIFATESGVWIDMNSDGLYDFTISADMHPYGGISALGNVGTSFFTGPVADGTLIGPSGVIPTNGNTNLLQAFGAGPSIGTPGAFTYGISFLKYSGLTPTTLYGWLKVNSLFSDIPGLPGATLELLSYGYSDNGSSVIAGLTNPVPEPETYAMLLTGLGLLGFVARRRKNSPSNRGGK